MIATLIALLILAALLWGLLQLQKMEAESKKLDHDAVILNLFYFLSNACVKFHKEKGRYPSAITGGNSLMDHGYLKEEENPLVKNTTLISMFSIMANENLGYALCLYQATPDLVTGLLTIARQRGQDALFKQLEADQYKTIEFPVEQPITLALSLPFDPA